jgi:hypothetical protein
VAGVVVNELVERLRNYAFEGDPPPKLLEEAADKLEKVEGEADTLAQEAARESARADAAETRVEELEPTIPPDFLNMP